MAVGHLSLSKVLEMYLPRDHQVNKTIGVFVTKAIPLDNFFVHLAGVLSLSTIHFVCGQLLREDQKREH